MSIHVEAGPGQERRTGERGFLHRYSRTLAGVAFVAAFLGYPQWLMRLNPVPEQDRLETLEGVVLAANLENPHIRFQTSGGTLVLVDIPGDLQGIYFGRRPRVPFLTQAQMQRLVGCPTVLRIDRLRYALVPTSARAWSIGCDRLTIPYEEMVRHYREHTRFSGGAAFMWFWITLLVSASLVRDFRRRAA